MDLTRAYHSSRWHNQRWFFDAETELLEPFAYDGFVDDGYFNNYYPPLMLQSVKFIKDLESPMRDDYMFALFNNEVFKQAYLLIAERVTSKGYLDKFFSENEIQMNQYQEAIQNEYPYYSYDLDYIYETAKKMRVELNKIE